MPEFTLDRGSSDAARRFALLDDFTQGYIEAMFWTETGSGDDGKLEDATLADLAPETWAEIEKDCRDFVIANAADLGAAYEHPTVSYSPAYAGHDYWLTRNGHGAGFWDRDLGDLGERLSSACRYDERALYMGDDDQLYLS